MDIRNLFLSQLGSLAVISSSYPGVRFRPDGIFVRVLLIEQVAHLLRDAQGFPRSHREHQVAVSNKMDARTIQRYRYDLLDDLQR
jgi:hypothetical protein